MKARSGIPVGMVPIRDENGDVRLISFEEYRQWLRTDPSEKGQHPINNPEWTVTEDLWLDEEEQRILEYVHQEDNSNGGSGALPAGSQGHSFERSMVS